MITPKIKALFQFIEYLHSNIDNFNQYNGLIKELELLNEERQKVSSKNTFKDKLKYDEIQAELESKFKTLQDNTANLIKAKAKELNVCNFDNEPNYSFNGIETDIHELKENFSKDDLPDIFKHKQQYIEYRTKTHKTFLSLEFFIDELDEITKSLFDYFKETEQNEFEAFETKAIPVNSIVEAIQGFKKGQTKFTLSNNFLLNTSTIQQQPKTDYWQDDAEEITLIAEYQKAANKLVEGGDTGCFPMRFRMLPRVVLNENKYSLQRKKYLLKQMRLVLDEVKNTEIGKELFTDLYERIEPYADIFRFVFSETPLPPQPIKTKPELNEALISFSSTEIIESLHNELKGYFQGKEAELKKALQGEQLKEFLLFPHNQNKFVEVFKRLKYNGFLLSTPKETNDWICSTFTYQYKKGNKKEVREFNTSTVHDILTKDKGEPTKKERICIVDWLPYKSHLTRQREAEKENI